MVVLLGALAVRPGIPSHACLDDELITLARASGDRLAQSTEGDEPEAHDGLSIPTVFIPTGVVTADETEAGEGRIPLDDELGVAREIADADDREAVHGVLLTNGRRDCLRALSPHAAARLSTTSARKRSPPEGRSQDRGQTRPAW